MKEFLRIGLSACFFHPDPKRDIFPPKTLLYFEESMARLLMSQGAYPVLLPRKAHAMETEDILSFVDGLILQAGSDLSPLQYKEEAQKKEWRGDGIRDEYEIELIHKAMAMDKPVLGICRGAQLINVALGGSLYQDIPSQLSTQVKHSDAMLYDKLTHDIVIEPNTRLAELYAGISQRKIISVHHQAVKELGKYLLVEACSEKDGIIEAIRYHKSEPSLARQTNDKEKQPYVFGVQWHPEYQTEKGDPSLMDYMPILEDFFQNVKGRI